MLSRAGSARGASLKVGSFFRVGGLPLNRSQTFLPTTRLTAGCRFLKSFNTASSKIFEQVIPKNSYADAHLKDNLKVGSFEVARIFDDEWSWKSRVDNKERVGLLQRSEMVSPEGFQPWVNAVLKQANLLVQKICRVESDMDAFYIVKRLDRLSDLLCSVIDFAEFVRSNHPSKRYAAHANQAYLQMASYMNQLNTTPQLYQALKKVLSNKERVKHFGSEELEAANIFLRDFEKSGIHLDENKRNRFVALNDNIIELGRLFMTIPNPKEKSISFSKEELAGCESWLTPERDMTEIPTSSGYAAMVLRTAKSAATRKRMYFASNTPSDEQQDVLERLLGTRADLADLLGHESFADFFLADKVARSPESVQVFLDALSTQLRPAVRAELNSLQGLHGPGKLEAWDQMYYSRMFEQQQLDTDKSFRAFFSVGTVVQGISDLLLQLYGIHFRPVEKIARGELWDSSVRKLEAVDDSGKVIGIIYMDLYSRAGKPNVAAHYTIQCSRCLDYDLPEEGSQSGTAGQPLLGTQITEDGHQYQIPVVVLVCGFACPTSITPSLLGFDEVETLFHEMGHAMHSMLARTDFHNVAGTRCKMDFVEFPSIFFEQFALAPGVVDHYARHYQTGARLPLDLLRCHLKSERALRNLDTQHQIMLSVLDQRYHRLSPEQCRSPGFSADMIPSITSRYSPISSLPQPAFAFKFTHLYSYSASYYSYLLGRSLAQKVWSTAFSNVANSPASARAAGQVIRQEVLGRGGSRSPWVCLASALERFTKLENCAPGLNPADIDHLVHSDPAKAMLVAGKWGIS
ncbi:Mitochondrial intermediate peptidase [Entomophthora muscae]|uniref:Mitochondrial intermediate peptidase n=1 Tax=Entomophthora muscae TaxID=34485 RepID=A0ACC2SZD0_9FUNG|nr:Mitochondrial intermediate peptidase [Entomophthora muscae]